MATCTDAERRILDAALASGAKVFVISELVVAKFLEAYPEVFEKMVRAEIGLIRAKEQAEAAIDAVADMPMAKGNVGALIDMADKEAARRIKEGL